MAVAYESDGGTVFAASANNNAITVPLPATRPTGSVLLFIGWCRLITATVSTAPSGYTLLSTFTSGTASGGRIWVYGRVVDGSESAPTFASTGTTGTSGDLWGACIFCYSGVDTSGGISAIYDGTPTTTDASGTTTCTYPALTISTSTAMLLRFLARFRDAADTFTFTATWNEREDLGSTIRLGGQFHLQDKLATASGSQASVTVAPSNTTAARYLAVTAALKQATAATVERSAAVDATAALASVATFFSILERASALAATGAIAAAGTFLSILERAATLNATGGIATSGQVERPAVSRSAAFASTASISTTGQRYLHRAASVAATGTVASAATFYSILSRTAAVNATAAVATAPQLVRLRSASLSATGGIVTTRTVIAIRTAAFNTTAALTVSGQIEGAPQTIERTAALDATAALAVSGEFEGPVAPIIEAAADLAATAALEVAGVGETPLPAGYIDFPGIGIITRPIGGVPARAGQGSISQGTRGVLA